jgi:hypothetical protein
MELSIVLLKYYLNINFHTFVLKNMDMCRNFKHSQRQNSAFIYIYKYIYIYIYIYIYDNIKRKQEKIKRKIKRDNL